MKPGTPIHVGGGMLVHLCHAVAYIPSLAGVMWHTEEDGYVLLKNDIRGHSAPQMIPDVNAFMRHHNHETKLLVSTVSRPQFIAMVLK